MRNYIFAPDCGLKVVAAMLRLKSEADAHGPQVVTKVLAGPHAVSVGYVVAELGRVVKRRPLVVFAASPASAYQALDLRLRTVVWPDVGVSHSTSFASGLHQTLQGLGRSLAVGDLA
jgi:UDP-glucose 4-epimerase